MRQFDPALAAHLASGATTLCWCFIVTRADGTSLGFTDHDRDIETEGVRCEAASGFAASEIESSLGFAADQLEVAGALSSIQIDADDVRRGVYDGAAVTVWRVNWAAPEQRFLAQSGTLGEIRQTDTAFTAEVLGKLRKLDQVQGRIFQHGCDATLGDTRCGMDLESAPWSADTTIAAVEDDRTYIVDGLSSVTSGWFSRGKLVLPDATELSIRLHDQALNGHRISLWQAPVTPLDVGLNITLVAGCDKAFGTCRDKFSNSANFRGFPFMPGNDFVFGYPRQGDGGNDGGSMNG